MNAHRTVAAVTLVVVLFAAGIPVVASEDTAAPIGQFARLGMSGTLTEQDVTETPDGIIVHAPAFASNLKIEKTWLEGILGAWSATVPFDVDAFGRIVVDGDDTRFAKLNVGEEPVFTLGSNQSVEFTERPMWLSAIGQEIGVRLDFDDGNTLGQTIYVAQTWLSTYGIHAPKATHEDGTLLQTQRSADQAGWFIEIPHFSFTILTPLDIDVRMQIENGAPAVHTGEVSWNSASKLLETEVGAHPLTTNKLWLEKGWFDLNIPHPANAAFSFAQEDLGGEPFYTVVLPPNSAGSTVRFSEFTPSSTPRWSYGSSSTISTHAFNESIRLARGPILVSAATSSGNVSLDIGSGFAEPKVIVNRSWLQSFGIDVPRMTRPDDGANMSSVDFYQSHNRAGFVISNATGVVNIGANGEYLFTENRTRTGIATFDYSNVTMDVRLPVYAGPGYLEYGFSLWLEDLPWGQDPWNSGQTLGAVAIQIDDEWISVKNVTHENPGGGSAATGALIWRDLVAMPGSEVTVIFYSDADVSGILPGSSGIGEDILWDILTLVPEDAGLGDLVAINDAGCKTKFTYSSIRWIAKDSTRAPSPEYSFSDVDWGQKSLSVMRRYKNTCWDSLYIEAHYGYAWGTVAKTFVVGSGGWVVGTGVAVEGSESVNSGTTWAHHHYLKDPRASLSQLYGADGLGSLHSSVGAVSKNFKDAAHCAANQPSTWERAHQAIGYATAFIPYGGGILWELFAPTRYCLPSVTKYDTTHGSYSGAGGRVNDDRVAGELYGAFDSTWTITGPTSGTTTLNPSVTQRGRSDVDHFYVTCVSYYSCDNKAWVEDLTVFAPWASHIKWKRVA